MKVSIIGGGNFGTAIGNILACNINKEHFDKDIKLWIYDEKLESGESLCDYINKNKINVKYLPEIKLPENLIFVKNENEYKKLLIESDILIFVLPAFAGLKFCNDIRSLKGKKIVSLIKGFIEKKDELSTFTEAALSDENEYFTIMGANIASVMHQTISDMTIGKIKDDDNLIEKLFKCEKINVQSTNEIFIVELCGALKNIIAIAFGLSRKYSVNTQMSILRKGLIEMRDFIFFYLRKKKLDTKNSESYSDDDLINKINKILLESCGIPDLMVTCLHGRNANAGYQLYSKKLEEIENEMNGMKVHGADTAKKVYKFLKDNKREDFKLFMMVYEICFEGKRPEDIIGVLKE